MPRNLDITIRFGQRVRMLRGEHQLSQAAFADVCRLDRTYIIIPARELEAILDDALRDLDLSYPLRTRSKVVKQKVCEALGYPVPSSFSSNSRWRAAGVRFSAMVF